jgi:hypothetical protein
MLTFCLNLRQFIGLAFLSKKGMRKNFNGFLQDGGNILISGRVMTKQKTFYLMPVSKMCGFRGGSMIGYLSSGLHLRREGSFMIEQITFFNGWNKSLQDPGIGTIYIGPGYGRWRSKF